MSEPNRFRDDLLVLVGIATGRYDCSKAEVLDELDDFRTAIADGEHDLFFAARPGYGGGR